MNTKHTPGPWEVGYQGLSIYGPDRHGTTLVIARSLDTSRQHCDPQEAQANARLIAAAPELLECCQQAMYWLDNPDEWSDLDEIAFVTSLDNAIRKATGQE